MQCAGHDARPFRAPAAGEEAAASCAGRGRPAAPRCRLSHAAASPRQGHSLETVNESEGHGVGKHPVPSQAPTGARAGAKVTSCSAPVAVHHGTVLSAPRDGERDPQ